MSAGQFALVYKVAVARSHKTEEEFFPTVRVIPPAGAPSSRAGAPCFTHGFSLCADAIRNLDPETERMVVSATGDPAILRLGGKEDHSVPAYEKDGWRVFIEWEA